MNLLLLSYLGWRSAGQRPRVSLVSSVVYIANPVSYTHLDVYKRQLQTRMLQLFSGFAFITCCYSLLFVIHYLCFFFVNFKPCLLLGVFYDFVEQCVHAIEADVRLLLLEYCHILK